jgi:hypothetical protein
VAAVVSACDVQPHRTLEALRPRAQELFTRHPDPLPLALHTSLLEGINNKIKVIKRMAYGFRDDHYFFLKIRAGFPGNA